MKSISDPAPKKGIEYPILMVTRRVADGGDIVLFSKASCGTVVGNINNKPVNKLGWYYTGWLMNDFDVYNGTIIMDNGE